MRISVLGASGFIGSHIVARLLDDGHDVVGYSRSGYAPGRTEASGSYRHIRGDFASETNLAGLVGHSEVCFHLVSTSNPASAESDPALDIQANLLPTVRLAQQLAAASPKTRLIFVSSGGTVYGDRNAEALNEDVPADPISTYGATKSTAETYIRLLGRNRELPFLIVRPSNLYGPPLHGSPFGLIHKAIGQIARGEDVDVWGDGQNVRDYLHIDDFVDFLALAATRPAAGSVVNVGSGIGHTILEVIGLIEAAIGRRARLRFHPARPIDVRRNVLDVGRVRHGFGWSARIALADGIRAMAAQHAATG